MVVELLRPGVSGGGGETRSAAELCVGGAQRGGAAPTPQRGGADRLGGGHRDRPRHRVRLHRQRLLQRAELVRINVTVRVPVQKVAATVVVRVSAISMGCRAQLTRGKTHTLG